MADHVVDVLSRCHRIMKIGQETIDNKLFLNRSAMRDIIDGMMGEALQYNRQRRNRGAIRHT